MSTFQVIVGPMFSGKSEELIRILRRHEIANKKILVVKPAQDTRTTNEIASRHMPRGNNDFQKSGSFPAHAIKSAAELSELIQKYQPEVLALDEAQFFEPWIVDFISKLLVEKAKEDFIILAAGLDLTYKNEPFGAMPELMALADEVKKLTAICFVCRAPAMLSRRTTGSKNDVVVGDAEIYQATCRACHTILE